MLDGFREEHQRDSVGKLGHKTEQTNATWLATDNDSMIEIVGDFQPGPRITNTWQNFRAQLMTLLFGSLGQGW